MSEETDTVTMTNTQGSRPCTCGEGGKFGNHHDSSCARYRNREARLEATEAKREASRRAAEASAAKREPKASKEPRKPRPCLCGCGDQTKGGDFCMGHDARYKSALIRTALDDPTGESAAEARATLESRGWTKFLDKAQQIASRPKASPTERRQERAERAVDTSAERLGRLAILKEAAEILRKAGRYSGPHKIVLTNENAHSIVDGSLIVQPADEVTTDQEIADNAQAFAVGSPARILYRGQVRDCTVEEILGTTARVHFQGEGSRRVVQVTSLMPVS